MLGKHSDLVVFADFFLLGLLSARRVRVRERPGTPMTASCSYLVPAMGVMGLRRASIEGLGSADSDPMFGDEVGSMIDRVEEGDLFIERCPSPVRASEASARPRGCSVLDVRSGLCDRWPSITEWPWNQRENLEDAGAYSVLVRFVEEIDEGMLTVDPGNDTFDGAEVKGL